MKYLNALHYPPPKNQIVLLLTAFKKVQLIKWDPSNELYQTQTGVLLSQRQVQKLGNFWAPIKLPEHMQPSDVWEAPLN